MLPGPEWEQFEIPGGGVGGEPVGVPLLNLSDDCTDATLCNTIEDALCVGQLHYPRIGLGVSGWWPLLNPENLASEFYYVRANLLGKSYSEFYYVRTDFLGQYSGFTNHLIENKNHLVGVDDPHVWRKRVIWLKNMNNLDGYILDSQIRLLHTKMFEVCWGFPRVFQFPWRRVVEFGSKLEKADT